MLLLQIRIGLYHVNDLFNIDLPIFVVHDKPRKFGNRIYSISKYFIINDWINHVKYLDVWNDFILIIPKQLSCNMTCRIACLCRFHIMTWSFMLDSDAISKPWNWWPSLANEVGRFAAISLICPCLSTKRKLYTYCVICCVLLRLNNSRF